MTIRRASHAGSWYHQSNHDLTNQLGEIFGSITPSSNLKAKAIIAPHAGYRHCGTTLSCAYRGIDPSAVQRVFIIGPCHQTFVDGCAIPDLSITEYATPFGSLQVDTDVIRELKSTPEVAFRTLRVDDDEEEHSIEMQLPLLHYVLRGTNHNVKVVPIFVGSIVQNEERIFGRVLSKYFDDAGCLFIISSDFCHWGHRFRFTPSVFPDSKPGSMFPPGSMNANIEALDRQAMDLISRQDTEGFSKYLQITGNTICGRYPILILMEVLRNSRTKHQIEFVHYSQSNPLPPNPTREDSCVSYAAGVCYSVM